MGKELKKICLYWVTFFSYYENFIHIQGKQKSILACQPPSIHGILQARIISYSNHQLLIISHSCFISTSLHLLSTNHMVEEDDDDDLCKNHIHQKAYILGLIRFTILTNG